MGEQVSGQPPQGQGVRMDIHELDGVFGGVERWWE